MLFFPHDIVLPCRCSSMPPYQIYSSPHVSMTLSSLAHMTSSSGSSVRPCVCLCMHRCHRASVRPCFSDTMCQYIRVSVHPWFGASVRLSVVFPYLRVPMRPCVRASISLYVHASLHLCVCAPMRQYVHVSVHRCDRDYVTLIVRKYERPYIHGHP